ncbi:hypothetical protein DEU56DRAFT_760356, partial [Suillus clintonianus]|uniref:uncharacterized protein n=1 Tax=Suillus clintonianus TaxID=1904413 RepID=UPI001B873B23
MPTPYLTLKKCVLIQWCIITHHQTLYVPTKVAQSEELIFDTIASLIPTEVTFNKLVCVSEFSPTAAQIPYHGYTTTLSVSTGDAVPLPEWAKILLWAAYCASLHISCHPHYVRAKTSTGSKFAEHRSDLMCRLALQALRTVTSDDAAYKGVDVKCYSQALGLGCSIPASFYDHYAGYKDLPPFFGFNSRLTSYIKANSISRGPIQIGGKLVLSFQWHKDCSSLEDREFISYTMADVKRYRDFLVDTGLAFLAKWPERAYLSRNGIPAEGPLTPDQFKIVQTAIKARKTVSNLNIGHRALVPMADKYGTSGTIRQLQCRTKLGVTLNGGDELKGTRAPQEVEVYSHCHYESRVKVAVNAAITAAGGTSSRGEKLSRAGFVEEVSDDAKIQAFNELGPTPGSHLPSFVLQDWRAQIHLHCGWTGRLPSGRTDTGGEFATCYPGFSDVQAAYANFLKEAISHDDNMLALVNADVSAETRIDNELGEAEETDADVSAEARINNELGEAEETNEEDKDKAMRDDEDERNTGSAQSLESLDLYHIGPQE